MARSVAVNRDQEGLVAVVSYEWLSHVHPVAGWTWTLFKSKKRVLCKAPKLWKTKKAAVHSIRTFLWLMGRKDIPLEIRFRYMNCD